MPVHCAVCNSSFKDPGALQMHKTAKGHNEPAVRKASGGTTFRDQSQTKSNPSNTAPSTARKVERSGRPDFRCSQCCRSFLSRGALAAHTKASHSVANTTKLKPPGKTILCCHSCGRCDFVNHDALKDHQCSSRTIRLEIKRELP